MNNQNQKDFLTTFKNMVGDSYFRELTFAVRSNGKSKPAEDFNILDEYQTRFSETPSVLKITHDDCDIFLLDKFKTLIKKEFINSKIIFNDTDYNLKRDKYIPNREVWYIDDGYILNLWTSESKDIYANPEIDVRLNRHDGLIEGNSILVPPHHSIRNNKEIEKRIFDTFKKTTIKEYERNSIGMMSVDGSGDLYVKEFTLDKKFKINDLDIHYGDGFKEFSEGLFKKLKTDTKGLVLLHGDPGTGKCVDGSTIVTLRNKKTGVIENISIENLFNLNENNIKYINDEKFIETSILEIYEVLTDSGWENINAIHKTIKYDEWILKTEMGLELTCADTHIVFDEFGEEVFVKDLFKGLIIKTKTGLQQVWSVKKTDKKSNMYDLDLNDNSNHRYYTNGILSHNTFFLRYLLQRLAKTKKKVLYFPPSMVEAVTDPAFFNFIMNWTMDNGKNSVLLIEDAEPLLLSRESGRNMGITNLLNLTDGILNDILSIQIISTFNTSLNELDKALLRPERLIARKEFKKLTIENGKKLAEILKLDPTLVTKEMSLADIYSIKNNNEVLLHGVDKSLAYGDRKAIGFGSNK